MKTRSIRKANGCRSRLISPRTANACRCRGIRLSRGTCRTDRGAGAGFAPCPHQWQARLYQRHGRPRRRAAGCRGPDRRHEGAVDRRLERGNKTAATVAKKQQSTTIVGVPCNLWIATLMWPHLRYGDLISNRFTGTLGRDRNGIRGGTVTEFFHGGITPY